MASEGDEALRESARHRGLKLVKSRRRKAGGDFGKYGLTDAAGQQLFGFGEDGLTASAEDIAAYLRGAMRSDGQEAAKGLPKAKRKPAWAEATAQAEAQEAQDREYAGEASGGEAR
jgi:hypothetical protein